MSNIHSLRKLSEADKENVKRANSFMIDPRIIQIEPGFNLRGMFTENYWEQADTLAHIEQFAKSYRNGDFVPPIVVKVINGVPFVRDGEHRLRALQKIIAEGVPFARVEVVEASGDELAQAKTNFNANNGRQWSAVERAVHYGRFKSYGMTIEEIANEVGHTVQHVYQLLTILEMPLELKRRIQNGEISASAAISQFKNPSQTIVKRPPAKLVRSAIDAIRGEWSVTRQEGGKVLVELTAEQFEALKALKEHEL